MRFGFLSASFVAAFALLISNSAYSQKSERVQCSNGGVNSRPDITIGACTSIIRAGKLSGKALAEVYFRRAAAHVLDENGFDAVKDFTAAIELAPTAEPYYSRGMIHHILKNYDAALSDFSTALSMQSDQAATLGGQKLTALQRRSQIFAARAKSYYEKKEADKAMADASAALKLDPENTDAMLVKINIEDDEFESTTKSK
jgi:tetratricopeptide (TPR) repeat protein